MTNVDKHPPQLPAHLEHFRRRVLYDALLEATSSYWLRRAHDFDAVGTPTCDLIALNCRHHAQLLTELGLDTEAQVVIDDILKTRRQEPT